MTESEILNYFKKEYIKNGYMYSGAISINNNIFYYNETNLRRLIRLVKKGKIVRRKSEGISFELPKKARAKLIKRYNLAEKWQKKAPYFYPNISYGEVEQVMGMRYAEKYKKS